jgi:tetratricopeptide (TPR) repeat protein
LYEALEYFNQAIALDPMFAHAHAGVASVYWLLTSYDVSLDRKVWFDKAEASAKFALEIDPESVDALGALAAVYSKRGDIKHAADLFDRIRLIGAGGSDVISWEATLHLRLGYFEELVQSLSVQHRRDPLNEIISWALADALIFSGRPAEAIVILEELQDFTHRDYYLALAAIYSGDLGSARELLQNVEMRSGTMPAEYADLLIDALEDPGRKSDIAELVFSAAMAGELDKLVGFESLLIIGSPLAFDLGIDPVADIRNLQLHAQIWNNWAVALRQDPRFKDWVEALGYVDFWRKYGWPDRCRPTSLTGFECI